MLVQSVKGIPISDGVIFPGAIIKGENVTAIIKITAATQILHNFLLSGAYKIARSFLISVYW